MLPSVVEDLYDELDGVSDLVSPVQPLQTKAVTDDDQCKRNSHNTVYNVTDNGVVRKITGHINRL